MTIDVIEAEWDLDPDTRVKWLEAVRELEPEVVAATVVWLRDSVKETPSLTLFMATYRQTYAAKPKPEPTPYIDKTEWFQQQRQKLAEGALRRKARSG